MPIYEVEMEGKMYYQWGDHGKMYLIRNPNSEKSRQNAYDKAAAQARAAYAAGYRKK